MRQVLGAPAVAALAPSSVTTRVRLTYSVESEVGIDEVELPFVIGVIGDLAPRPGGPPPDPRTTSFVDVLADGTDLALRELAPQLDFSVVDPDDAEGRVMRIRLEFRSLSDFSADAVAERVPHLQPYMIDRTLLSEAKRSLLSTAGTLSDLSMRMPAIVARVRSLLPTHLQPLVETRIPGVVARLVAAAAAPHPSAEIDVLLAGLDAKLERQVAAIRSHGSFRRLEASWLGIDFLARTAVSDQVRLRVLPFSREQLEDDMDASPSTEKMLLYRLTYAREYGILGGQPFGLLCLDVPFGGADADLHLLNRLALLGSRIHAPIAVNVAPDMLGLERFSDVADGSRDLGECLRRLGERAAWASLRRAEQSRYLALPLPHVLARDVAPAPIPRAAAFLPEQRAPTGGDALWMSAIYPFAQVAARSFVRNGWSVAITGLDSGGRVEDLPRAVFASDPTGYAIRPGLDAAFTESQEDILAAAGFVPLLHCQGRPHAAFFRAQSAHQPQSSGSVGARLEARLQSRLALVFAISRVAHYLKVITRENIGIVGSRIDLESRLNRWLANHVAYQDNASAQIRARRPLRYGSVRVEARQDEPGVFNMQITMQPHFQFDEFDCAISLTTQLEVGGAV